MATTAAVTVVVVVFTFKSSFLHSFRLLWSSDNPITMRWIFLHVSFIRGDTHATRVHVGCGSPTDSAAPMRNSPYVLVLLFAVVCPHITTEFCVVVYPPCVHPQDALVGCGHLARLFCTRCQAGTS